MKVINIKPTSIYKKYVFYYIFKEITFKLVRKTVIKQHESIVFNPINI